MSHDLNWYKKFAEENDYELGKKAEKIIEMVDKCEGHCPCKYAMWQKSRPDELDKIICPCEDHKKEIEETGHCHCCLLKKKEE